MLVLCPVAYSQVAQDEQAEGIVTGHVYCEDTNGPARMARVMLEPVKDVSDSVQPGRTFAKLSTIDSVQTGLDGSFTMKSVKPGAYYILAEMAGYLSPLAGMSADEWTHPTASVADRMAKVLQRVTVEGGRTANVNIGLARGAAVSGTISFDDGSPASGIRVKVLREKSDGSWDPVQSSAIAPMFGIGYTTDDLGHYRMAGLTAGKYVIEASLLLSDIKVTGFMGQSRGMSETSEYSLSIFSGGALRASKDAAFALTAGESRPGEDIVIPLSKLHSVSGTVVASHDGRPLAGDVELLYGDDKKSLATAELDSTSGEYRFAFVPEGHFTLKVTAVDPQVMKATDAKVAAENPGYMKAYSKGKHVYGALEQPLDVNGDIDGLVLSVPDASASPAVSQSSANSQ